MLDEQERREIWTEKIPVRINAIAMTPDAQASEVRRNQLADPLIAEAIRTIEANKKPPSKTNRRDARAMIHEWKTFKMINGILHRLSSEDGETRNQYVVPTEEQAKILHQAHSAATSGHFGIAKTMAKLRTRFYWPLMKKDVQEFIKTCAVCQQVKTPGGKPIAPLVPIKIQRPFQIVTSDFLGDFPKSRRGNQYIIVFVDKFTKYVEAYATPDVTAESFAWALRDFICRHSMPEQLLTDQGSAYESHIAEKLCELLDIEKLRTTPFHPQCNGQSENANKTIVQLFRTYIESNKRSASWDDLVPLFTFAHNVSTNATTGEMPFEAVYGREPRIPLDLFTEVPKEDLIHHTFDTYVTEIKNRIKEVFKRIQTQSDRRMRRAKIDYDRRVRGGSFNVGDQVYLLRTIWNRGMYHKFQRHWLGPYKVIGKIGPVNYVIEFNAQRKVVHSNLLKKAHDRVRFVQDGQLVKLGRRVDKDLADGEDQLLPKKRGRPKGSKNKPKPGSILASAALLTKSKRSTTRRATKPRRTALRRALKSQQVDASRLRRSPRIKQAVTISEKVIEAECNRLSVIQVESERTEREKKRKMTRNERRALKESFRRRNEHLQIDDQQGRAVVEKQDRVRAVLLETASSVGQFLKKIIA